MACTIHSAPRLQSATAPATAPSSTPFQASTVFECLATRPGFLVKPGSWQLPRCRLRFIFKRLALVFPQSFLTASAPAAPSRSLTTHSFTHFKAFEDGQVRIRRAESRPVLAWTRLDFPRQPPQGRPSTAVSSMYAFCRSLPAAGVYGQLDPALQFNLPRPRSARLSVPHCPAAQGLPEACDVLNVRRNTRQIDSSMAPAMLSEHNHPAGQNGEL